MATALSIIFFGLCGVAIAVWAFTRGWTTGEVHFFDYGEVSQRNWPWLYWLALVGWLGVGLIFVAMTVAGVAMLFGW